LLNTRNQNNYFDGNAPLAGPLNSAKTTFYFNIPIMLHYKKCIGPILLCFEKWLCRKTGNAQ